MSDPRVRLTSDAEGPRVLGARCAGCGRATVALRARCAVCGAAQEETSFASTGTVASSTVVRIAVGDLRPPYALAYLDLDDGPRVLTHVGTDETVPAGRRLRIVRTTERGDVLAEVI